MYLHVYTCMYIMYVSACVSVVIIYLYVHMYVPACVHMHVHHVCISMCICCNHILVCTHVCTHVCIRCMYTCMYPQQSLLNAAVHHILLFMSKFNDDLPTEKLSNLRAALGTLERRLQLSPGKLLKCTHWTEITKNSHTFHDILQTALQDRQEDDHLKDLNLYDVTTKVLFLDRYGPGQGQAYCNDLCIGYHGMLQPLMEFIGAIERELDLRLHLRDCAEKKWIEKHQLELRLHPLLRSQHMGSSWTVPAISAIGVMHFPLPARPSQVEFHEEKDKGNNVKEGIESPKEKNKKKRKKAKAKATAKAKAKAAAAAVVARISDPQLQVAHRGHGKSDLYHHLSSMLHSRA